MRFCRFIVVHSHGSDIDVVAVVKCIDETLASREARFNGIMLK